MSINGPSYDIVKIIGGKRYNTGTAKRVHHLDCHRYGDDLEWENTDLYLSPKNQWFLAGRGNALSRWGRNEADGSYPGKGIQLLTEEEAQALLQQYGGPFEVYFEAEEG